MNGRLENDGCQGRRCVVRVNGAARHARNVVSEQHDDRNRERAAFHTPPAIARAVFIAVRASSARDANRARISIVGTSAPSTYRTPTGVPASTSGIAIALTS